MATLEPTDSNILEADAVNWRLVAYPLIAVIAVILCGFGYYYYSLNERAEREAAAQDQMSTAKTPEDFEKVASDFPGSTHATLALLNAASASFDAKNYDAATKDYQRVVDSSKSEAELRDSAQIGLAACLEQTGKADDAIKAYQVVAQRGSASGFAPFAYTAMARLYDQKGDKENERRTLTEAANLNIDSPFVKEAAAHLKSMTPEPILPNPVPTPAP